MATFAIMALLYEAYSGEEQNVHHGANGQSPGWDLTSDKSWGDWRHAG
jgi:hypothetical protein